MSDWLEDQVDRLLAKQRRKVMGKKPTKIFGEHGTISWMAADALANREVVISTWSTELPTLEGKIMLSLLDRVGLIAAEPAGEDSAGRQALTNLDVDKTVQRAADIAEKAAAEMRKRGWLAKVPSMREAWDQIDGHDDD